MLNSFTRKNFKGITAKKKKKIVSIMSTGHYNQTNEKQIQVQVGRGNEGVYFS